MIAFFARELLVVARRRPFAAAAIVLVAAVTTFAVAWPGGVPLSPGANLLIQVQVVQELLVAAIAPWVVCRCGARERGNDLVYLAILSGLPPSRIVVSRFLGASAAVIALGLTALPIVVYAQQAAAVDPSMIAVAEWRVVLTAVMATGLSLACEHLIRRYAWRWLAGTAATFAACIVLGANGRGTVALLAVTVASIAWIGILAVRADTTHRYLAEDYA